MISKDRLPLSRRWMARRGRDVSNLFHQLSAGRPLEKPSERLPRILLRLVLPPDFLVSFLPLGG